MSRRRGRDRDHQRPRRPRTVQLRLSHEEFADLSAAARDTGLTPTGYAAEAAVAAARGRRPPEPEPWRAALAEVMAARTQVRRFGVNVNQAVRAFNVSGEAPASLSRVIAAADQAVQELDAAAAVLADRVGAAR